MAFVGESTKKKKEYKVNQITLTTRQKERLIDIVSTLLPDSDVSIGYISNSINPMYGFVNIDGQFIHWYELCTHHLPKLISSKSDNKSHEILDALKDVIDGNRDIIEFYYKNFISK